MITKQEIDKIVEFHNWTLDKSERKGQEDLSKLCTEIYDAYTQKTYDFSAFTDITRKQGKSKRRIKMYDVFSCQSVLCEYLKKLLDRKFKIKYPNRNKYIRTLFNVLSAAKQMNDFTIVKFDFKDFFNSVSSVYVYEKFLKNAQFERYQVDLLKEFVETTRYAYAGINTSNIIAEIAAQHFDDMVRQNLSQRGLVFFERYIDDSVLVFNQHIEQSDCIKLIENAIKQTFFDKNIKITPKCKVRLNDSKTKYITRRAMPSPSNNSFDFLGYEFTFVLNSSDNEIEITYGITDAKIEKYNKRVDKIIDDYIATGDVELLRHRILAFTSRTVYISRRYRTSIWKAKGFISNYNELRFMIGAGLVAKKTEVFLKSMVFSAFKRKNIDLPYFIRQSHNKPGYNLHCNLQKNKTLLFVEKIGFDKDSLKKLCRQIGINTTEEKGYENLVRDYLIKVKVGY